MPKRPARSTDAQLNPQTLRILAAIAEHGSLAAAAARVNLVPSAVSRRIQELESVLGVGLLRRTPRAVEFSAAGLALLERARRILAEIDAAEREVAEFSDGSRGRVRLAASVFALFEQLPEQLARFSRRHPRIALEFQSLASAQVVAALQRRRIDLGIVATPQVPAGLRTRPYRDDRLAVLAPARHPLARLGRVHFAELARHELVAPPPGTDTEALLATEARRLGTRLRSPMQVSSLDAMVMMVQAGFGLAVVPSRAWTRLGPFRGLRMLALDEPWASRRLVIGHPADAPLSPPARLLLAHLTAAASGARARAALPESAL